MHLMIGNLSIHVETSGAGSPALVFLHYWGGSHRTWDRVIDELNGTWQCVAYDSRGWGLSERDAIDFSITALADEAMGSVEALGFHDFVLVGHSMGGKVAQFAASRRPEGLRALVLLAPATPTPTHLPNEALQQQLHAYDSPATVEQTIGFLSAGTLSQEVVAQIIQDSLAGTTAATKAWPTSGILEDISEQVCAINVPTLVIAGGRDNLDSVEQHKREVISRIPKAELVVIPESGHLLPYDAPERVATEIRRFLVKHL